MFEMPLFLVITGFFAFLQIEFWMMFPKKLRDILVVNPVMAFIISFISSLSITVFTGVASFVGMCNVSADIIFTIWVLIYRHQQGIKGLGIGWYKAFGWIPLFPKLEVIYQKGDKTWRI